MSWSSWNMMLSDTWVDEWSWWLSVKDSTLLKWEINSLSAFSEQMICHTSLLEMRAKGEESSIFMQFFTLFPYGKRELKKKKKIRDPLSLSFLFLKDCLLTTFLNRFSALRFLSVLWREVASRMGFGMDLRERGILWRIPPEDCTHFQRAFWLYQNNAFMS